MIARSPEQVRQIERRFLDPLVEAGRDDLARTLTSLARSGFDRSATSDELGIHRNTLTQRIDRAAEIAGIDLGDPSVRGSLWIVAVAGDVRRALPEGPRRDPRT
jgi:Regulator of polyketide synthase expression